MEYKIFSIGENALTIDFGNEISAELNDLVLRLADSLKTNNFVGFTELVPAYSSLTIFFDLIVVRKHFKNCPSAFFAVQNFVVNALKDLPESKALKTNLIKIPVCYDETFAPDLGFIAESANVTKQEVIRLHISKIYRVYMIGFLPGFAYMGEIDDKIAVSRQSSPRVHIEKGSVGIAGKQTGIYPIDSPGGWQIIGKTPLKLFQPDKKEISLLQTGDSIQFYEISVNEFAKIRKQESKSEK